jgi:hypothetical protein
MLEVAQFLGDLGALSPVVVLGLAIAVAALLRRKRQRNSRAKYFPNAPTSTLKIEQLPKQTTWRPAAIEGRPAMHASGEWRATNATNSPVQIVRAYLEQSKAECLIVLFERNNGRTFGVHEIAPQTTVDVSIDFWIDPPTKKPGESHRGTVVFVDQFENKHFVKRVKFVGIIADSNDAPIDAEWIPDDSDSSVDGTVPIELQVAAFLHEELKNYEKCGRRIGGLGSVQTRVGNSMLCGVGSSWRQMSEDHGPLLDDSGCDAEIESDVVTSMVMLYRCLNSSDQLRFIAALRRRLGRYGECAPVGYLTLLVLFRTGDLRDALTTARAYLQGDEGCGFSEFLLLLDGLLRFEHRNFSEMMLRDVERFVDGLDEYAFGIPDRVAEIHRRRQLSIEASTDALRVANSGATRAATSTAA